MLSLVVGEGKGGVKEHFCSMEEVFFAAVKKL